MTNSRFIKTTHPIVLHCFTRDVFMPLATARGLTPVVYEDGYFDRIDYSAHLRSSFSWHAPKHAEVWFGKTYGSGHDLNTRGPMSERSFFLNTLFPHARAWGIAIRWEGGTHAHMDAGGNESFGDSASLHGRSTHIGSPSWNATGNPIAVDGAWGKNTARKMQKALGVAVDGDFGPASTRALQERLGVVVDGSWGPGTASALAKRIGTQSNPYPRGRTWGNKVLQARLMLTGTI